MKMKKNSIFNNYYFQLISNTLLAFILLLVAIILINNSDVSINLVSNFSIINSMFIMLMMGLVVYSYNTGSKSLKFNLLIGKTRKNIYNDFVIRTTRCIVYTIIFSLVVTIMNKIVNRNTIDIYEILESKSIFFLVIVSVLVSNTSYLLGLIKLDKFITFIIYLILVVLVILFIDRVKTNIYIYIILSIVDIALIIGNRLVIDIIHV